MVASAEVAHARPFEILISDDDDTCRETVREALEPKGYQTHLASCGREAIALARRRLVHVVIVDMHMPDLNGLETVRIIRQEISIVVPTILMSADPSDDLMRKAMTERCDSFIPKPFDLATLREVVDEILRRHYGDM